VAASGQKRNPKLSVVVARKIEDELVRRGWPIGEVIASESELLERFGVSRAALREAIRIVEHTGGARMCKGPRGGLMVTEPSREIVSFAAGVYFASVGVTVSELLDAYEPLLLATTELAAKRADVDSVRAVLELIEQMAQEHRLGAYDFIELQTLTEPSPLSLHRSIGRRDDEPAPRYESSGRP
jgi:DNA-binding FadR family transcriptional regulator